MTVTVTVDEVTARRMVEYQQCERNDCHDGMLWVAAPTGGTDPVDEVEWVGECPEDHSPSVRWLVVDSPLVCEFCGNGGGDPDAPWIQNCPDCSGTGLPQVEIVSEHLCFHEGQRLLCKEVCDCGTDDGLIAHGTITIGAAVPIMDIHSTPGRWAHPILEVTS